MIINIIKYAALLYIASGSINVYKQGWLERVVQYHKRKFIEDVKRLPPVQIKATIAEAPPGYVDSKDWDFDSVARLLTLMRESESARPAYKQLRRMLRPTRRILMSKKDSYKFFPNIHPENYYESSGEFISEGEGEGEEEGVNKELPASSGSEEDITRDERAIVIVTNPVEARLPSARISVKMLREIMVARAAAARIMPSTTLSTIEWKPMNRTSPPPGGADGGGGDGNSTAGGDGAGNGTAAEGEGENKDEAPPADGEAPPEDPPARQGQAGEEESEENEEEEEEEVTTKKVTKKTAPKKNVAKKNAAKKIKRRGRGLRLGKKRKVAAIDRRIPFRVAASPRALRADHPLRNGFGGGYYENYHLAKHRRPRKIKNLMDE